MAFPGLLLPASTPPRRSAWGPVVRAGRRPGGGLGPTGSDDRYGLVPGQVPDGDQAPGQSVDSSATLHEKRGGFLASPVEKGLGVAAGPDQVDGTRTCVRARGRGGHRLWDAAAQVVGDLAGQPHDHCHADKLRAVFVEGSARGGSSSASSQQRPRAWSLGIVPTHLMRRPRTYAATPRKA